METLFTLGLGPLNPRIINNNNKYMERFKFVTPKTQGEARMCGIEWQQWASNQNMSYGELAEDASILTKIAEDFDLVEEFIENGII